jgi:hypothetical protein
LSTPRPHPESRRESEPESASPPVSSSSLRSRPSAAALASSPSSACHSDGVACISVAPLE